jgi:predicted RNA-binding protein with TRAM domain
VKYKMNRNFGNSGSRDRFGSDRPRNNDFGNAPPVNVGEELDVKIEAVGEKGDGVAKKNGFVIFVPGVKEGQNVRVKVTRVLRKVGFAEVVGHASAPSKDAEAEAEPEAEYSEEKDSDNFGDEESSDAPAEDAQAEDPEASEDFGDEEEEK